MKLFQWLFLDISWPFFNAPSSSHNLTEVTSIKKYLQEYNHKSNCKCESSAEDIILNNIYKISRESELIRKNPNFGINYSFVANSSMEPNIQKYPSKASPDEFIKRKNIKKRRFQNHIAKQRKTVAVYSKIYCEFNSEMFKISRYSEQERLLNKRFRVSNNEFNFNGIPITLSSDLILENITNMQCVHMQQTPPPQVWVSFNKRNNFQIQQNEIQWISSDNFSSKEQNKGINRLSTLPCLTYDKSSLFSESICNKSSGLDFIPGKSSFSESIHDELSFFESIHDKSSFSESVHDKSSFSESVHDKSSFSEFIQNKLFSEFVHNKSSFSESIHDKPSFSESICNKPSFSESIHDKSSFSEFIHDKFIFEAVDKKYLVPEEIFSFPVFACDNKQEIMMDTTLLDYHDALQYLSPNERFLHFVVKPRTILHLMSIKNKLLASKDPFTVAKLSKVACFKEVNYRGLPPQEFMYKEVTKMGGNNSRFITVNRVLPVTDEYNNSNPNVRKLMKNAPREVYKRSWRQEKRLRPYESSIRNDLINEKYKPKVPKRGTYIKHRTKVTEDKETSGESEKENKLQVSSTVSNSDSSLKSLPSRSEVLPPDGDSFHSDEQKNPGILDNIQSRCSSCSEIQLRLSKAHTEKGVLTVCLEKAQRDNTDAQKKIKELEVQLKQINRVDDQPCVNKKDLEAEMCQLQKDKAILNYELQVTRKQLIRYMDQYDASDSSHVSSVYVPGSEKNSDEDFISISHDEPDDYFREIKEQLETANTELERLKDVEIRNEELESAIRHCEDRIIELQEKLKYAEVEKRDASAQTIRKDGTFTRPPDKTKIPKRLFATNHSSLPVITDPSTIHRFKPTTSSFSRVEMLQKNLAMKEKEITNLRKNISSLEKEMDKHKNVTDWTQIPKLNELKEENEKLKIELKSATENYRKEMVMRKKYFNMAEEMKGKIRVFCRIKPRDLIRKNFVFLEVPDDYSVQISTQRGTYEFTFDNVFTATHTQDDLFEDVETLVQSALDGYNVCIFAYGQTGSGKTYTLVGTDAEPGIGPKAFQRIFELVRQNQSELDFRICASFFELYNDSLIDLLKNVSDDKLKIRRDHHGLVYVQGSECREVKNDKQLLGLFQEACRNRHVGSTRMNKHSSRSHLIVTVLIESTNKITGTVLKGKLSLVDLAGSERIGKTAAVAGQLKEANSINKSLSALGDVIAALSSEQQHVPYRNNKLTLLMQDSLGSNAKTLMFVTISSSELNIEESLNSLTYASRVKQITNTATRISESKEIARLRSIIMKLSKEGHKQKISSFIPERDL